MFGDYELPTHITFWLNPEYFKGTIYENIPFLVLTNTDEVKALVEDVLDCPLLDNIATVKYERDDGPVSDIDGLLYTVFKVDSHGWMDKVGWTNGLPPNW